MKHSPSSSGDFARLVCWTPGLLDSADWMLNSGPSHCRFVYSTPQRTVTFVVFLVLCLAAAPRRWTTFHWEFVVGVRIASDTKLRHCRTLRALSAACPPPHRGCIAALPATEHGELKAQRCSLGGLWLWRLW